MARVANIDYSKEGINKIRNALIKVRDKAMDRGPATIEDVAVMNHAIALLADYRDNTEEPVNTTLKVGDTIEFDSTWYEYNFASKDDCGDAKVIAIGKNYVVLQEDLYDLLVLFPEPPRNLEKLVKKGSK